MGAVRGIVIWATVAVLAAAISGFIAARKNRNVSSWAAWGFIFPPALLALAFVSSYRGPPAYHPTLDDEDREAEVN